MSEKDYYITEISNMCPDRYGSLLLQLLDECGVTSLREVTLEQAKVFYEKLKYIQRDLSDNY